jgi:hypothetical protein
MRWRAFFFGGCAARRRFDLLFDIKNEEKKEAKTNALV